MRQGSLQRRRGVSQLLANLQKAKVRWLADLYLNWFTSIKDFSDYYALCVSIAGTKIFLDIPTDAPAFLCEKVAVELDLRKVADMTVDDLVQRQNVLYISRGQLKKHTSTTVNINVNIRYISQQVGFVIHFSSFIIITNRTFVLKFLFLGQYAIVTLTSSNQ